MANHLKTNLTRQEILGLKEAIGSGLVSQKDVRIYSYFDLFDRVPNIYLSAINLAFEKINKQVGQTESDMREKIKTDINSIFVDYINNHFPSLEESFKNFLNFTFDKYSDEEKEYAVQYIGDFHPQLLDFVDVEDEPSKRVIEVLPRKQTIFFKGIEKADTALYKLLKNSYSAHYNFDRKQWHMPKAKFDDNLEELANELDALGFDLLVPDDYASVVDPTQLEQPPEVVSEEITVTYEADNYTTLDELDASFVRAGINSKPRDGTLLIDVTGKADEIFQTAYFYRTKIKRVSEQPSPLGRSEPVRQEFLEKLRDSLEPYGLKIDRLETFDKLVADYEFGIFSYELPYNTSYEKVSGEGFAPTASIYGKDTDWSLTFKGLARAVHFEGITQANFNRAISEILNYFKIQPEQEFSYIAIPDRGLLPQAARKLGVLNIPIIKPLTDEEILEAGLDRLGDGGKMVDQGFPRKPSQLRFYKIPKTTIQDFEDKESVGVGELLAVGSTTASGQEEIIDFAISIFNNLSPDVKKRINDSYFRLLKKDEERALNQLENRMRNSFLARNVYFPFPLRLVLKSMAERVFVEPSEPIPERRMPVQAEEPSLDYDYLDYADKKIKTVAPLVNEFLNVIYAYNQTSEKELLETFKQLKAAKYAGARLYSAFPSQYMQLGGIMLNIPIIFEGGTNADAKLTLTAEKHVLKGTRKTTVFVPELSIRYGNEWVVIDDPFEDFYKKEGRNLKATITTADKQKRYQRFLKKYGLNYFDTLLQTFIFKHLIMGEDINGMSGTASMGFSSGSSTYVRAYLELGSAKLDFETILKKLESPKYIETEGRSSYTAENIIPSELKARSNPNHRFIKSAFKGFKKKGTEGSFTRYVAQNFKGKNTPSKRKKAAQQIKKEYEKWERGGRFGSAPYSLKTYKRAIFYLNILEK